ncbi:tetratricopeptide repeat-containing glycosyltransferase family protein [Paraburkholderia sp. J41]|uniref:tetratricopeptide repeat-containing glycosyltransferase family protein n=1 Tax=Paraburkholderia sp. J41 TaxID=2805433 RepID=UPI002AC33640|nr:tetratricopeptide repeat-containing glycosyltransferase family protein [Paraburkholderia sp. J41]
MPDFQNALEAHRSGAFDEAQRGYHRVLQNHPQHADAIHLLGLIEFQHGRLSAAESLIRKALSIGESAIYYDNLGNVLTEKRHHDAAEAAYRRAIELDFHYASSHYNFGTLCLNTGRVDGAEEAFRRAIALQPGFIEAYHNLSFVLSTTGRHAEAEQTLQTAREFNPTCARTYRRLGRLKLLSKDYREAEVLFRRAIELEPNDAASLSGLAAALTGQGRIEEALVASTSALAIDPRHVDALINRGAALLMADQLDGAEVALRSALALEGNHSVAKFNLSVILLKRGRYEEGWELHEARNDLAQDCVSTRPFPIDFCEWQGESLLGKSLLVLGEQGCGDILQFCRYLPMLKELGAVRVTVVCPESLRRLIEKMDGVDSCMRPESMRDLPRHDFWCFISSLPLRFKTTLCSIPRKMPYLTTSMEALARWRARLPAGGFKVGLVWAGDPRQHMPDANLVDRRRSLHARDFEPLLKLPGVTFVSLQLGTTTRPQIEAIEPHLRPLDPMGEVADFADTAAIIECLDLVVTVDTSTAHLTGALNRPVWILSRFDGCWRWLIGRDDSPWYPSARLFRQERPGEWGDVIERVTNALAVEVAQFSPVLDQRHPSEDPAGGR